MQRPEQFRDPQLETSGEIIGFYPREFYVFDNFASFQVEYAGRLWPTSEHAYQASHFFETAPEIAEEIFNARSAHDAYKIAKANADKTPENWDEIKVEVMYGICKSKLCQNPYVFEKLELSGDLEIIEDSPKDSFWGWGPNRDGRNELGKIWMRLRDEVRSGVLKPTLPLFDSDSKLDELRARYTALEVAATDVLVAVWKTIQAGSMDARSDVADKTLILRDALNPNWPANPEWLPNELTDQ